LAAALFAALALSACTKAAVTEASDSPPARVEAVTGSDLNRVILSAKAVERLDITTVPVREAPSIGTGPRLKVIPYAALLYDPIGGTWAYTTVGTRTFERSRLMVERIDGDAAYLSDGPPVGTPVVTVGAAELYGTEFLSNHE
jgi:hypothetical protein